MKQKKATLIDAQGNSVTAQNGKTLDLFRLFKYIRFNWFFILLALAVAIAEVVISTKIPDETSKLFDGNFSMDRLWSVIGNLLLTLLLALISGTFSLIAAAKASLSARKSVWNKLMNVKMSYYDTNSPNALLTTVTADAEAVGGGLSNIITKIPSIATFVILCAVMVSQYNSQLLLLIGVIIAIHIIYMVFGGMWQRRVMTRSQIQIGFFTAFLAERIRNFPMIKSYGTQKGELENGVKQSKEIFKIGKLSVVVSGLQSFYQAGIYLLTTVITVVWGCALIRNGSITVTQFIAVNGYIQLVNVNFILLSIYWVLIQGFSGIAYRITRLCEAPQETTNDSGITEIGDGDIKFDNVDFSYTNSDKIIKNVSFTVPAGKITALVGPSGSGKTTIVKLLENLYSPTAGSITLGGTNINEYNVQAWRKKLAYVVQDAGIFSGTLRECLTYGVDREVSDAELDETVKLTGLYDYIYSLPLRYQTPVLNWGRSLSGGQRQRVVISRALLRNADILIFDEPTSALDPETANAISKLIFEGFSNKTKIIISHELNYIAKADNIVFLHNGIVEGEGDHQALMNNCQTYHDLVKEQSYQEVFGK